MLVLSELILCRAGVYPHERLRGSKPSGWIPRCARSHPCAFCASLRLKI
jgi:hypothetical protein